MNYVYLLAIAPIFLIWVCLYGIRKDQRLEMLHVGVLIGFLSVVTSYLWWTTDWWTPPTLFGTTVGIEDFLLGFLTGGIMSCGFEILNKHYDFKHNHTHTHVKAWLVVALVGITMSVLFWIFGLESAISCFLSLCVGIIATLMFRPDLWKIAIGSGMVTLVASIPFYYFVSLYPAWVEATYPFEVMTGIRIAGLPLEEFIFWFLAGCLFGPFYELQHGYGHKKTRRKSGR